MVLRIVNWNGTNVCQEVCRMSRLKGCPDGGASTAWDPPV